MTLSILCLKGEGEARRPLIPERSEEVAMEVKEEEQRVEWRDRY